MFALTLVDHLRLTFGHVVYTHRVHSQLAWRQTRWNRWLLGAEAILILGAALSSMVAVSSGQWGYAVAAAAAGSAAVCALVFRLVFDFERSAIAHRACSARLWRIREEYRALLADLKDETISLEAARERRDTLTGMLHALYENAPPADRGVYDAARRAMPSAHEDALTDEEVDRFLPRALQKTEKAAKAAS
jgi:hypothetical protein